MGGDGDRYRAVWTGGGIFGVLIVIVDADRNGKRWWRRRCDGSCTRRYACVYERRSAIGKMLLRSCRDSNRRVLAANPERAVALLRDRRQHGLDHAVRLSGGSANELLSRLIGKLRLRNRRRLRRHDHWRRRRQQLQRAVGRPLLQLPRRVFLHAQRMRLGSNRGRVMRTTKRGADLFGAGDRGHVLSVISEPKSRGAAHFESRIRCIM
jgi:hypothetical protein